MTVGTFDLAVSIGGAAGQGIATPGNILARLCVRRGLHFNAYNAYQSIIRGGHIFLTMRLRDQEAPTHGDKIDLLVCLNQDTMNRHLGLMTDGGRVRFNGDKIKPGKAADGVLLCPLPIAELTDNNRNKLIQNTVARRDILSRKQPAIRLDIVKPGSATNRFGIRMLRSDFTKEIHQLRPSCVHTFET